MRRRLLVTCVFVVLVMASGISLERLASVGGRVSRARLKQVSRSKHFADGTFHNQLPDQPTSASEAFEQLKHGMFGKELRVPPAAIPVEYRHLADYAQAPASGLRVTWMGHASTLVELDGRRILTDPVWSERASPVNWAGPQRFHPVPIPLEELPRIDAVVISHDHYDHLDMRTIQALARRGTHFIVPLGVGAHLERWGVPQNEFTELDWGEQTDVAGLTIIATEARHYSGRSPLRSNQTLWVSWVVKGPAHRFFYSGDTGYGPHFKAIGEQFGPFDVTLMKIGASDASWAYIHMSPEEAVQAHLDLRGMVMIPVHWGTFNLAFHAWDEPAERAVAAARSENVNLIVPRPGNLVEPTHSQTVEPWWRAVR